MATSMERRAYELSQQSPLRVPNPDSLKSSRPNNAPHSPVAIEPGPQWDSVDGFPAEGAVMRSSQRTGFGLEAHAAEMAGPSHRIVATRPGSLPPDSYNAIGGHLMPPAVQRWEEQPERDKDAIPTTPQVVKTPVGRTTGYGS